MTTATVEPAQPDTLTVNDHDRLAALVRSMADVVERYGSLTVHEGSELHARMVALTTKENDR